MFSATTPLGSKCGRTLGERIPIEERQLREPYEEGTTARFAGGEIPIQCTDRITGAASAFANSTATCLPFRTLFTKAGRKQASQVPPLCRTLG
jgi:hypothetical protein